MDFDSIFELNWPDDSENKILKNYDDWPGESRISKESQAKSLAI